MFKIYFMGFASYKGIYLLQIKKKIKIHFVILYTLYSMQGFLILYLKNCSWYKDFSKNFQNLYEVQGSFWTQFIFR